MIWESSYWKEPLLESASRLRKFSTSTISDELDFVTIEKDIFLGFYTIRKLMDTAKISTANKEITLALKYYPNIKSVDYLNWHKIDELYDLDSNRQETRKVRFVCNLMIHSYVFLPDLTEDQQLNGFYFASDTDKNKKLYHLGVTDVIDTFELFGNDYPSKSAMTRNEDTGEWEFITG
ncbi:hypothetical protein QUO16_004659 [Vibrio parahaemolyticus]|uniref:hypothetical protein n=1 Tax=Vibrio parahaemolyticus TaxID=670 RepID=UPI000A3D2A59|nr:hypothetical protein [Vibrio parahaemolyticus]ELA9373332.1 hypothetical protein [Vibrio parahaemolyticus]OUJ46574.1 hypothetical protein BTM22_25125 [Vibrio parahaemolyticus]TOE56241.1 hypothetical protein CGJ40_23855 [Vibrio parahaemolyticus]HCG8707744.1 hypothetical protein [Vibrio parahaemolyticus]